MSIRKLIHVIKEKPYTNVRFKEGLYGVEEQTILQKNEQKKNRVDLDA